jgi:hypothetical protein
MPDTPIAIDQPRIIATASSYDAFLQTIRDRVAELGITYETLDAISGLQSGYTGKLLAQIPIRRMGPIVLFLVLQSLGLQLGLLEDRNALRAVATRLVPRKVPLKAPRGEGRKARAATARWHNGGAGVAAPSK